MRRRGFIRLIGGAVAAWPIVAHAQRTVLPRIGVLVPASPEPFWSEFRAGLRERGFVEGQNIALELRSGQGKLDRLRDLADELVRLKIEIIVAHQTPAVIAARHATSDSDRYGRSRRSGRDRSHLQLGSAGWQYHRIVRYFRGDRS